MAVAIAIVLWDVLRSLGLAWYTDDNYSHGFFIAPLAAYFAWERRAEFTAKPIKPSAFGLIVVAGSLRLLVGGILGSELFISRVSVLGVLTGTILFLYGWQRLRVLAFPLAFMLLMIPIPAIIFNQIAFPLQLLASNVGEYRSVRRHSDSSRGQCPHSRERPSSKWPRHAVAFDPWYRCLPWGSFLAIS